MKKGKKYGIIILGVLLIGLLFFWWQYAGSRERNFQSKRQAGNSYFAGWVKYPHEEYWSFREKTEERTGSQNTEYDSLLLTSYRCRLFDLESLNWGFGVTPKQAVWRTGSVHEVKSILETVFQQKKMSTVFLELDPRQHNQEALIKWIGKQTKTQFYIFFSPYPVSYWERIERSKGLPERMTAYKEMGEQLSGMDNVMLFYFDSAEWMAASPHYFKDGTQVSQDGIHQIYSAFGAGNCRIEEEEPEKFRPVLTQKEYADFSGQVLFCFGDSMLGKDRNESGAAEAAAGFLNAQVYNAAVSGSSASGNEPRDLSNILDMLLDWEQEKNRLKTAEYQEQIPKEAAEALIRMQDAKPDYIILAYGYNDYSAQAYPYEDALWEGDGGQNSFPAALRENIRRLKAAYPDAKIIVSTVVTSSIDLGGEYPLRLYAKAAQKAAEAEQVYCLYNFETGKLVQRNLKELLSDGVHFNVKGRFLQADRIAEFLETIGKPSEQDVSG